ncbi:MAG: hypothetical protein M3069_32250 [Chloroflexota bacterium]|nr:hypothetical protein [Chloroflexota bacterium]
MQINRLFSARAAIGVVGMVLGWLTLACSPAVVAAPTPVSADPFTVVRATSQAAYASGRAHLERGQLQQALVDLDTARTNDPDNRADIEQALSQTISQLALQTPTPEPTAVSRAIVLATVAAARPANVVTPGPDTPAPSVAGRPTAAVAGPTSVSAAGPTSVSVAGPTSARLVEWRDPQGRFTLSAPDNWARSAQPVSLFGTSVVQFNDPSVRAELDVAVDASSRPLSPELYAATLEIAMQRQVPGYAAEQTLPGSTSGNPSVRRVYIFTQRAAAGTDTQARGFQVAVVKGSTAYLISGSAPADQFETFNATFDQMLETFRFS